MPKIEYVEEIASTNTALMQRCAQENLPAWYTLCTFRQTAGRGQRGNGWESEPDKNISFTTVLECSSLQPEALWRQSMLVALAVAEALDTYGLDARIKWPNDIYVGDLKICGILIENVLQGGRVKCSLAGVGLNINQRVFLSGAPNPTSMCLLTGCEYEKTQVLETILLRMQQLASVSLDALRERYMQRLYRREGFWRWREVEVTTAPMAISRSEDDSFEAQIADITEQGLLVLATRDGRQKSYHFKEIKYIIK